MLGFHVSERTVSRSDRAPDRGQGRAAAARSPYDSAPRHLIFDRDSIFSAEVVATIRAMGIKPTRAVYRFVLRPLRAAGYFTQSKRGIT